MNTPPSPIRLAIRLLTAAVLLSGCSSAPPSLSPPPPVPSPSPAVSLALPTAALATSAPPSPTTRPVVGDGEAWLVFQSLADQFDPFADHDGIDHDDTVFLVRPDGTGLHRLPPADMVGSEIRPTWSPDGLRVAFIRGHLPGDVGELWAINADGTGAELLYTCSDGCNTISYPDWSPDGKSIYFDRDWDVPSSGGPPLSFGIWRYDLATHVAGPVLTRHGGVDVVQGRISPDGRNAVYVRCKVDAEVPECGLFVADLKRPDLENRITKPGLAVAYPDWSARDRITFNTYDLRNFATTTEPANLYSIGIYGDGLKQLTSYGPNDTRATQPRWTSDGHGIVYTLVTRSTRDDFGIRHVAYLDVDGTAALQISDSIIGTHPELRPAAAP